MTRIEKQIVLDALGYYVAGKEHELEDMMFAHGESEGIAYMRAQINIARTVMTDWKGVVDMPCGTVSI